MNFIACLIAMALGLACTPPVDTGTTPIVGTTPVPAPTLSPLATPTPLPTPTSTALPPPPSARARLAPPVPRFGAPVIEREIARGPVDRPAIALTFDMGVDQPETTRLILDTLVAKGVRATMFLVGEWAERNPAFVQRMAADGHEFGNHSYSHADFVTLPEAAIRSEIQQGEAVILRLTGQTTKPFLRPPSGSRDVRVTDVIEAEGYYSIYWTIDNWDWREGATPATVHQRVLDHAQNGAIVVLHLSAPATAASLADTIDALRAQGYQLVTLSELLAP